MAAWKKMAFLRLARQHFDFLSSAVKMVAFFKLRKETRRSAETVGFLWVKLKPCKIPKSDREETDSQLRVFFIFFSLEP